MRVAAAIVVALALACRAAAGDEAPAGRLEVPEPVYDAGTIEHGASLRHDFVVKNTGTAPLAIDAKPG
jgi:hypothetical protein